GLRGKASGTRVPNRVSRLEGVERGFYRHQLRRGSTLCPWRRKDRAIHDEELSLTRRVPSHRTPSIITSHPSFQRTLTRAAALLLALAFLLVVPESGVAQSSGLSTQEQ